VIYTVTLNPALDRYIVVDRLLDDDTTRVSAESTYAAGKGIDVSRVIHELRGQSVAMGFVGGYDGSHLEGLLINAGVLTAFTRVTSETRTNIILREEKSGKQYSISAHGPEIKASEIGELYHQVLELQDIDYLVMSGSLPRGVNPNVYGQLILAGRKKNAFVLLDADGEALRESMPYHPTCIKPNRHELSRLVERSIDSDADVLKACDTIHEKGIPQVLVSLGKEGMILSTKEKRLKGVAPPVEVSSTVGAGDSAVAGYVLGHCQGKDPAECLKMACAAGTATARTPGTELCRRADVEEIMPQVNITEL